MPKKRVAAPLAPPPEVEIQKAESPLEQPENPPGSGIVEPLDETSMAAPVLDAPPQETESGKRFICAADGKPFSYRSELERHVKRNFPEMYDQLMAPYPP